MSKAQKSDKTAFEQQLEERAAREASAAASAGESGVEEAAAEVEAELEDVESAEDEAQVIEADLTALVEERETLQDQLLRLRADFDNYRKRMARENERIRKTAGEAIIADLLPVIDNLELALQHKGDASDAVIQGVDMVRQNFLDILGRHGLQPIPTEGCEFDPQVHDAISQQPSDTVPNGHVMQEFQRGYRLADMVLRPAKVVVSKGPEGTPEAEAPAE